jgi:CheY-like chemotaxis protein
MTTARVLIVDDDRVIQELLRVNLELEGYTVEVASDGEEALTQFDAFHPQLVLLDVMMPKLDGWQVARRLKGSPERRDVPIVMLSAKQRDQEAQPDDLGVAAYVTKPFDPIKLLDLVADLLASSPDSSEGPAVPQVPTSPESERHFP